MRGLSLLWLAAASWQGHTATVKPSTQPNTQQGNNHLPSSSSGSAEHPPPTQLNTALHDATADGSGPQADVAGWQPQTEATPTYQQHSQGTAAPQLHLRGGEATPELEQPTAALESVTPQQHEPAPQQDQPHTQAYQGACPPADHTSTQAAGTSHAERRQQRAGRARDAGTTSPTHQRGGVTTHEHRGGSTRTRMLGTTRTNRTPQRRAAPPLTARTEGGGRARETRQSAQHTSTATRPTPAHQKQQPTATTVPHRHTSSRCGDTSHSYSHRAYCNTPCHQMSTSGGTPSYTIHRSTAIPQQPRQYPSARSHNQTKQHTTRSPESLGVGASNASSRRQPQQRSTSHGSPVPADTTTDKRPG